VDYAKEYGQMHTRQKSLSGYSLKWYVNDVRELVERTQPESILDYGSGKGYQYLERRQHDRWGGLLPYCYDIGVPQLSGRPDRKFDGLICTDVLEHIETSDIPGFLDDVLSFLSDRRPNFAMLTAACMPARKKRLSDGRNVHVTVRPPEWWEVKIQEALDKREHPELIVRVCFGLKGDGGREIRRIDL